MSSSPSSPEPSTTTPAPNRRRAYLLKSDQPFARSALKRQSVMTLPSIAHLQHGFAKIGIESSEKEKENRGIGRREGIEGEEESWRKRGEDEGDERGLILGPEPERPRMSTLLPWETGETGNSVKDEKELRNQVFEALNEVRGTWQLSDCQTTNSDPSLSNLLLVTTSSIRSIQQWLNSLPSTSTFTSTSNLLQTPNDPLSISTAARPRTSLGPPPPPPTLTSHSRRSSSTGAEEVVSEMSKRDRVVVRIRKQSLDVLGMLKEVEEQYRTAGGIDASFDVSASELVKEDREDEASEVTIYDESVSLESLTKENELVKEWIGSVQLLLDLSDAPTRQRGRRSEGSMRDEGFSEGQNGSEEEKLPSWAQEEGIESSLDRAYSIIQAHLLPVTHSQFASLSLSLSLPLTSNPTSRLEFLSIISTGTVLCQSYNQVLASSSSPFGFIPSTSIHEFSTTASESSGMERSWSGASDGGEKVGNTFRRVQNLQSWAAALKHRYSITLSASNPPSSTIPLDSGSRPFDARVIASRKEGWEGMLEKAVGEWAEAVAKEERENC